MVGRGCRGRKSQKAEEEGYRGKHRGRCPFLSVSFHHWKAESTKSNNKKKKDEANLPEVEVEARPEWPISLNM